MSLDPLVSVIMPVYNAERYLSSAVESILNQSYKHLEFIIINDGSTDSSMEILKDYQSRDNRITLLNQPNNLGIVHSLNAGLFVSKGKLIARMDADDISLPERLSHQVDFMEGNPEVGLLGCKARYIDQYGDLLASPPMQHGDLAIRWQMLFGSPFFHSSVMVRASTLQRHGFRYEVAALHAEDYQLWSRIMLYAKAENLRKILLYYRLNPESTTMRNIAAHHKNAVMISTWIIQKYLPGLSIDPQTIREFWEARVGISQEARRKRARLIPLYLQLWREFSNINKDSHDLISLRKDTISWAVRMSLFPPLQKGSFTALVLIAKEERKWPLYLLSINRWWLWFIGGLEKNERIIKGSSFWQFFWELYRSIHGWTA